MKEEYIESLGSILGAAGDDKSIKGHALYELMNNIEDAEEKNELFRVALEQRDSFPPTKRSLDFSGVTDENWDQFNQYHRPIIRSHMKLAFVNADNPNSFAKECLKIIDLFPSKDEKIFAVTSILYSAFVPYRPIIGSLKSVSESEYQDLLKTNQELRDDLNYVHGLPFEDLPSECLNVLNVLNKTDDEKLKVALLALYVSNAIRIASKGN